MDNLNVTPHPVRKKFLWLTAFLLVLVVVGFGYYFTMGKKDNTKTNENTNEAENQQNLNPVAITKDVPKTELPDKLPKDIPLETGAKITQNYTASSTDGRSQSTRVFETKKSLDENRKIYADYLAANGWKIVGTLNESGLRVITAIKDKSQLQITINQNTVTNGVTVEIVGTDVPVMP